MTRNAKLSLAIAFTIILAAVVVFSVAGQGDEGSTAGATPSGEAEVVRENTHYLDEAGEDAPTFVEFLDFECEACLALFPVVEQLREEYEGEVNFAIRYFPNEGHFNGELAARAVEAASKQGKLEEMYRKMFETQTEWGEQQASARETFVGFAEELGLDTEQFEEDLDAQSTLDRVAYDRDEGLALGVQGTPTLFLDGEMIDPAPFEEMKSTIDAALEE